MAVDKFPVEAGHIKMFARSIGDDNQIYYSEDHAKGTEPGKIIAPPTFAQASAQFDEDYFLRPKIGQPWFGSGKNASSLKPAAPKDDQKASDKKSSGGLGGGLHAEQHFEYHRHPGVGDVLTAQVKAGKKWEKQGRSGKLIFSESITEYRDQAGELVITARSVGVQTQRPAPKE